MIRADLCKIDMTHRKEITPNAYKDKILRYLKKSQVHSADFRNIVMNPFKVSREAKVNRLANRRKKSGKRPT